MARGSIEDLRNDTDDLIHRVERGESIEITRDRRPVALLRPSLPPGLPMRVILERFQHLPKIDPIRFRQDIDDTIDTIRYAS